MNNSNHYTEGVSQNIEEALAFVDALELPGAPRRKRSSAPAATQVFDATKNQAMVVGSDIVSFVTGLRPELREIIVNCSLLAQLAANQRMESHEDIRTWYEVYFDTLIHLGWVLQERGFSEHHEAGDDFETNQAILSVAAVLFGPASTALAVLAATLSSMKAMSDGPWMTIFKRESQAAKAARFQVTVAEPGSEGGSMISLMAFELIAKSTLLQVLFFKFHSTDATLRHASGKVTIDTNLLAVLRLKIAKKVALYTRNYIEALPI